MSEEFRELFSNDQVSIEEIYSHGSGSEVYDQDHDEWVYLVKGWAKMIINDCEVTLNNGESLMIRAHEIHQVIKTSQDCHWIAVHLKKCD